MTSPTGSLAADKTCLCISTSGPEGSLAIGEYIVEWNKKAMHSELATTKLSELLQLSGISLSQISHIAVNVGPGSFTGIRVGINLARSLAYALALPILPLSTFSLLAHRETTRGQSVFIALKAVQNYFYVAGLSNGPSGPDFRLEPRSATTDELQMLSSGYAKILIESQSADFHASVSASVLSDYVKAWSQSVVFGSWRDVQPMYVRASEPEEKLRKGLLKPLS